MKRRICYVNLERHLSLQARPAGGLLSGSIHEEGNLKYDYFFAAEAPDDLLLVETWTEQALQNAHCSTEIFAQLQALKARYCDSVSIDKFNY